MHRHVLVIQSRWSRLMCPGSAMDNMSDNRLATGLDIYVFDSHLLLAFAAVFVERCELLRIKCHQLVGVLQGHITPFECLV